ncbi:hypothetical protein D3C76_1489430 [compost metagenome]
MDRVCVDDYFMGDGSGGKRTRRLGIYSLYEELQLEDWYDPAAYRRVYEGLQQVFSEEELFLSQKGFEP